MQQSENQEFGGVILEALPNTTFRVKLTDGREILVTLAGRMRKNFIRVLPGDEVRVEITPYDLDRGRIVWKGR